MAESLAQPTARSGALLELPWRGKGSAGRPGWILRQPGPPTTDVTESFKALYGAAAGRTLRLPAEAHEYTYLLIGGLFGKRIPGYMAGNAEGLREVGLETQVVPVQPEASVEDNAEVIREAIEAARARGRRVVLIGHSKGGVDAAAALSMHPELKGDVRALIAMQAPFGGSPIAQDIGADPRVRWLVREFVRRILEGDPRSVRDLSYDAREAFLARYPLPTDVPTLCVATSRTFTRMAFLASRAYLDDRYGLVSDGLVVPDDAVMPGARVIRLNDMDHNDSTRDTAEFQNYRPEFLTQALVALALESPAFSDAGSPASAVHALHALPDPARDV